MSDTFTPISGPRSVDMLPPESLKPWLLDSQLQKVFSRSQASATWTTCSIRKLSRYQEVINLPIYTANTCVSNNKLIFNQNFVWEKILNIKICKYQLNDFLIPTRIIIFTSFFLDSCRGKKWIFHEWTVFFPLSEIHSRNIC